jgi:hypothetical protein
MPSQVWGRDPQDAFEEPYEYAVQEQFQREAEEVFRRLYHMLNSERHSYSADDRSPAKAVWLLAMDALDSLRDCLTSLARKEHRLAGKLFRDIMESMDLAAYFHAATEKSSRSLRKWYNDEIVPHREYRDYVRKSQGSRAAKGLAKHYASLSRFTHRSYRAILDGYLRGDQDRLVHDGTGELYGESSDAGRFLVLPQTIASYYALLANLALEYMTELSDLGLASTDEVRDAFFGSLEKETVPRRFLPRRWLAQRLRQTSREGASNKRVDAYSSTRADAG